jgi:hypothetical protein
VNYLPLTSDALIHHGVVNKFEFFHLINTMDSPHEDLDQKIKDILNSTGATLVNIHINYILSDFYYHFTCCDGMEHGLSAIEILQKYHNECQPYRKHFCVNPTWHSL